MQGVLASSWSDRAFEARRLTSLIPVAATEAAALLLAAEKGTHDSQDDDGREHESRR